MTLEEQLEYYKNNVLSLQEMYGTVKQENAALEAKNWNLHEKLKNIEAERDGLIKEVAELKEEKNVLLIKHSQNNNDLLSKIIILEVENKDVRNKGIKLQQEYQRILDIYYEKYTSEIAKARNTCRRQEVLDCIDRNNGNKAKTAKELGISRETVYKYINKR